MVEIPKIFKRLNGVGTEVSFNINGYSRTPSLFATCLSLLGVLAVTSVGSQFILKALDSSKPKIIVELKSLPETQKIILELSQNSSSRC